MIFSFISHSFITSSCFTFIKLSYSLAETISSGFGVAVILKMIFGSIKSTISSAKVVQV